MIKKSILYLCVCFCVACGSNKSIVRTTNNTKPVVRAVKKPIQRPTETKTSNQNQQEQVTQPTEVLEATTHVK